MHAGDVFRDDDAISAHKLSLKSSKKASEAMLLTVSNLTRLNIKYTAIYNLSLD